jgi:hypothetical protein
MAGIYNMGKGKKADKELIKKKLTRQVERHSPVR